MITSYKRRFVFTATVLAIAILTIVFSLTAVYIRMVKYRMLENTMRQVVRPVNSQGIDSIFDNEARPINNKNEEKNNSIPPEEIPDDGKRWELKANNYSFAIYAYNEQTGSFSVISESDFIDDEEASSIIESVVSSKEEFGSIKKLGVFYLKEKNIDEPVCKIVLTAYSYYIASVMRDVGFMFALFLVLLLVFVLLSRKMSSYAAKPMEKAIELEKQFVTDVSHDLKTPITVILANNSIIKSSPDTNVSEQMQWINSTDTAARNMLEMINEMLTFSSLESEKTNHNLEKINASSAAEKCVLQFESIAYDREIEFFSDVDQGIFINSTQDYTERIFNSIIENAFKYEPNGGRIDISLKKEKKKAVFKVKNYGSYISQEDLPHIFERFYRADKTRNEKKGHGLGLPIVMQITNLINAKIFADSSAEKGTEFTVVFDILEK